MSFWTDAAVLGDAGIPSVLFGPPAPACTASRSGWTASVRSAVTLAGLRAALLVATPRVLRVVHGVACHRCDFV